MPSGQRALGSSGLGSHKVRGSLREEVGSTEEEKRGTFNTSDSSTCLLSAQLSARFWEGHKIRTWSPTLRGSEWSWEGRAGTTLALQLFDTHNSCCEEEIWWWHPGGAGQSKGSGGRGMAIYSSDSRQDVIFFTHKAGFNNSTQVLANRTTKEKK